MIMGAAFPPAFSLSLNTGLWPACQQYCVVDRLHRIVVGGRAGGLSSIALIDSPTAVARRRREEICARSPCAANSTGRLYT